MIIVSKHRDFYDSAIVGADKSVVYNRATDVICSKFDNVPRHTDRAYPLVYATSSRWRWNQDRDYTLFVVGFCGMRYVGAALDMSITYQNGTLRFTDGQYMMSGAPRITYDQTEIMEYFRPSKKDKYGLFSYNKLCDFMKRTHGVREDNLFVEHSTPVYLVLPVWSAPHVLVKDPVLKDLDFMKVMDPYTAHQELEMYLGDVLRARDKDTVEISDEDRAASRGFDKTSFRRDKHPSKPRRKNKHGES